MTPARASQREPPSRAPCASAGASTTARFQRLRPADASDIGQASHNPHPPLTGPALTAARCSALRQAATENSVGFRTRPAAVVTTAAIHECFATKGIPVLNLVCPRGRTMVASTIVHRRASRNPYRCSIAPGRRRSPATTSAFHQHDAPGHTGARTRPTRRRSRRSRRDARCWRRPRGLRGVIVVLWRAGLRTGDVLALNEPTSILCEVLCSFGTERAINVESSEWTGGHGTSQTMARAAPISRSDGCSASSADWHAPGCARQRDPQTAPGRRARGGRASAARAASAAARACGRDVTRGDLDDRDRAPTRARRACDHLEIPARDRRAEIIQAVHQRPEPIIPAGRQLLAGR